MYYAKGRGRDNYQFFRPDMNMRALEGALPENDRRTVIGREQVNPQYPPKAKAATGQ
jgi:hypothetical protein